jgi:hypothetical protein
MSSTKRSKIIRTAIGDIADPIDRFIEFIVEREAIRLRRAEGKPAPWCAHSNPE